MGDRFDNNPNRNRPFGDGGSSSSHGTRGESGNNPGDNTPSLSKKFKLENKYTSIRLKNAIAIQSELKDRHSPTTAKGRDLAAR